MLLFCEENVSSTIGPVEPHIDIDIALTPPEKKKDSP